MSVQLRRTRASRALAAVLVSCVLVAGCEATTDYRPQARLNNPNVLADEPVELTVRGLEPGATVEVTASTGFGPKSRAIFRAPDDGVVDLARTRPESGYTRASGYGLLWGLRGGVPRDVHAIHQNLQLDVTVDGDPLDSFTQRRRLRDDEVEVTRLRFERDGLAGYFFSPPGSGRPRPGVVLFGGSEGGISPTAEAQLLASHGYPALVIGYFKAPGVPRHLLRIPVEYFASALQWLADQPDVDADRVVPYGISRGGEAALLVAALRPDLAAGAVAAAPLGVAAHSVPSAHQPAWTWRGREVPYVSTRRQMDRDPGEAVIPVWRIDGPLLLVCGAADRILPACDQVDDVADRLADHGRPAPIVAAYDDVGHAIGFMPPGIPLRGVMVGEDPTLTGLARTDAWSQLLDYLEQLES